MSQYKSDLLRLLESRGYIHQVTDAEGLDALASREIVPGYIGFDATAPSLHVGSLLQIMMLRTMQRPGTSRSSDGRRNSKIGDPSFKDEARSFSPPTRSTPTSLDQAGVRTLPELWAMAPTDAIMVDNAEWLDRLEYIPFLREIGSISRSTEC
jgi:tyrosyl-tRNA synthetase